ncbi:Cation-independent mannose-6-phosphate receptor CI-MPR [Trichophyton interdigitale]|nr:Cation-independent mannose-6-phosphate receptor CI-MPR [Trichophyton interdigitale]KAG5218574.1 Cation-independent mannose-6-phosphate receptor CI-MPR [Trichophyton interdigitale]KAG8210368.1 Cation-independent mannose-6-phosphate receptor CI-MPR [Trichophyton interdigitale]
MHINRLNSLLQVLFLSSAAWGAAEEKPKAPEKPCTIHSPNTGLYFDLNAISVQLDKKDGKKSHADHQRDESWHVKGHDYGANFTINICAPVVENLTDVVGVDEKRWQNISAYYEMDGETYSIGQQSSSLLFRGRKLVLNYTDGSPCPPPSHGNKLFRRKIVDGDDDDEDKDKDGDKKGDDDNDKKKGDDKKKDPEDKVERRKSTIMSFLCDRDLVTPAATFSFVGSPDSCSYFFEVRTAAACGGVAASTDGGVGPAGIFGIIAGIAVAAYLIGGCAYQRTVMHQRGWRQCPNYGMWSGAASFVGDMFIILWSSMANCFRFRKSRLAYSRLANGSSAGGGRNGLVGAIGGRGRNAAGSNHRQGQRDVDEENRLIDQLDEEWDD